MDDDTRTASSSGAFQGGPGVVPAATTSVTAAGASRVRWIAAAVVTVVVLAAAVLAASLLGSRAVPEALRYVPSSSVVVIELRPELSGDQRDRLGDFLAHFPGFRDQANLDDKIDESLQLLVDRATDGSVDYQADVKPWLAGPAFVAMSGLPSSREAMPRFVAALTTDGSVSCSAIGADAETETQTYDGHELLTSRDRPGPTGACTLDGRIAIIGDLDSVKAALDTRRDGDGIAGTSRYSAAEATFAGDRLAAVFVDVRTIIDDLAELDPATAALSGIDPGHVPEWLAGSLRAEGDALVIEGGLPMPSAATGASAPATPGPAHVSNLAASLPGTTVAAFEVHDLGTSVAAALATARADPTSAPAIEQLDAAARMLGGIDHLTGWIGDAAIVVTLDGETPGGGLVVRATDPEAARSVLDSIRNLAVLAGSGSGISLDETDHDGTSITIVDVGDWSSLFGSVVVGGSPAIDQHSNDRATIAWAVRDDLVVVGLSEAFVASVLDVRDGESLADNDRYQHAIERAGGVNDSQGYVDVAAVVEHVGGHLEGAEADRWRSDLAPWLAPFEGVAFTSSRSDGLVTSRLVLTVR
jgi:hypothetical protein